MYKQRGLKGAELDIALAEKLASAEHKAMIDSEVTAGLVGQALNNDKFLSRYARIGNTDGFIKKAGSFLRAMVKELKSKGEENNELADIIMPTIRSMDRLLQMYDALDHNDAGYDNLILMSKMPRYITEKFGISGNLYLYRDHAYENMVSKEQAEQEGRPIKRGKKDIHFHNLGVERMAEAILSLDNPIISVEVHSKDNNPTVIMALPVLDDNGSPLRAVLSFYSNQNINGSFEMKPHIVLTITPSQLSESSGARKGWAEFISEAIEKGRVLDYDKKRGSVLSVIAQQARLGNITEASLNDSISRFKRFVNDFKQKNKIKYSLAPKKAQTNAKEAGKKVDAAKAEEKQSVRKSATVVGEYSKRFEKSFDLDKGASEKIAAELEAIENAFVKGDEEYAEVFRRRVGNIASVISENANFEIASDYDTLSDFSRFLFNVNLFLIIF